MGNLLRCSGCGSFVAGSSCPSCGGRKTRVTKLGIVATLLGSSAFAMTLMACYGCPDGECSGPYLGDTDAGTDAGPDAAVDAGTDE